MPSSRAQPSERFIENTDRHIRHDAKHLTEHLLQPGGIYLVRGQQAIVGGGEKIAG